MLTAESVFQAVRGNPMAAAASLDAMAQGVLAAATDVARTPLSGVSFTQRLVVALDARGARRRRRGARTPRAAAEPFLDDWVGTLLGAPTQIGCRVDLPDGSTHAVTLDALALRPLDLVVLARTPPPGLGDGELDRRVLARRRRAGRRAHRTTTRSTAPHHLAHGARARAHDRRLLAVARPLAPADLVVARRRRQRRRRPRAGREAAARAQAALAPAHDDGDGARSGARRRSAAATTAHRR